MKPTTDTDTIYHADDLWRVVHWVQDAITTTGELDAASSRSSRASLVKLRRLADELDPEYGRNEP